MLAIPTKGIDKSVKKHRYHVDVLCDWIEASVIFDNTIDRLSMVEVADNLYDEQRYVDINFALEGMTNAQIELSRRFNAIGKGYVLRIDSQRIYPTSGNDWKSKPAYVFCLLLSLAPYYDWWTEQSYTEQGEIFEALSKEAFNAHFPDWTVLQTGWSKANSINLPDVVQECADKLGEDIGDLDTWDTDHAKEQGLDLLCFRTFSDLRQGIPIYLMQCASGANWKTKLHTPRLEIWTDLINFKSHPLKAFSMPFTCPDENHFKRCCRNVSGLFLERCRLLSADEFNESWLSCDLKDRIIAWAERRVNNLVVHSRI